MSTTRRVDDSRFTTRSIRLALAAAVIAPLAACYVVPIDPRTGQGYPVGTT
jgi:hypothetical protein